MDKLIGLKIIALSMGSKHTIAIEQSKERANVVWVWGNGADGRLGSGSDKGKFESAPPLDRFVTFLTFLF